MIRAGPPAKAEARNLGPSNEECQNGLAGKPAYKKAVTRWIATAQNTDRYTNGMYLRLAFSIVVHMSFDVYLFDEVLGVGDDSFRVKVTEFFHQKLLNNVEDFNGINEFYFSAD